MPKTREYIEKKPGWQPYSNDPEWQKDLVAIRCPDMPLDGEPAVISVGLNGVHYSVPRSEDVKIPRLIKENLESRLQHMWTIGGKNQLTGLKYLGKQPRFYVIELSGKRAEEAKVVHPAKPLAAEQRVALEQAQILAAQEDRVAAEEIRNSRVPDALKE